LHQHVFYVLLLLQRNNRRDTDGDKLFEVKMSAIRLIVRIETF